MHVHTLQTSRQIHSSCSGVWDPWPAEHQSCDLNNIVVQKQRLALFCVLLQHFARFFSFLILTSSSRTCSGTQKLSRISVFSLLYCFQLIRRLILHFSNIQCCLALNRRFRFRGVVPNLNDRISHCKLPWDKYEFTRLAHWLDHGSHVSLASAKSILS